MVKIETECPQSKSMFLSNCNDVPTVTKKARIAPGLHVSNRLAADRYQFV
jgi:hypothetical protein